MKKLLVIFLFIAILLLLLSSSFNKSQTKNESLNFAFQQAAQEFHVPKELLETICYMEGDMSNHNGYPSVDNGYGCMHLIKNARADTLDEAATLLHVDEKQVQTNMATNIRGGAAILQKESLQMSPDRKLPRSLADWYGAVAAYSHAGRKQSALMYADAVYDIFSKGFSVTSDTGETITVNPHAISPNKTTIDRLDPKQTLPQGCVDDGKTDYPGAIDCMLDPAKYNCNSLPDSQCTYEEANRPDDFPITFVAVHYFEAYLSSAFALFRDPKSLVSIHYIVDTDGIVYQVVPEKDIAYHLGNYWYNQRSIGIEHTGFGPSGFGWFNAAEYLGSAKLTAYLAKKYDVPLDHDHIISHGIVPAATLDSSPNHVDPGQYWQWDKYFYLIHNQGVSYPKGKYANIIVSIHPPTNSLDGDYFYLYTNAGIRSQLIPSAASATDRIDESDNIEADISYVYVNKMINIADPDSMYYQIWYGENDNIMQNDPLFPIKEAKKTIANPSNWFANAKLAWLTVPKSYTKEGKGTVVKLTSQKVKNINIYSIPVSNEKYIIGNAPKGAVFVSAFTQRETDTNILWYEINYNHGQAWVPATEVSFH